MERITVPACAKVNLTLAVTGRRPDGYHLLETVFQRISLCDTLTLTKTDAAGLVLESNIPGVMPEDNIITRAYEVLRQQSPALGGIAVTLEKRIPMQAGLGGGSADCAAFLTAANRLYHLGLSREQLLAIGAGLGADVPACMTPGASFGRGTGELLTPIESRLPLWFVIVKPACAFSTGEMYRRLDASDFAARQKLTAAAASQALREGRLDTLCQSLYNAFEEVVDSPVIGRIKEALLRAGATGSLMTGSGSCVFGLFADREAAIRASASLRDYGQVFVCHSQNEECLE